MRHANKIAIACLFLMPLSASRSHGSHSQVPKTTLQDKLSQRVNNYEDSGDFAIMLGHLAQKYQLPMGVDLESPPKVKLTSVRLSQGTVAGVLTTLVSQEPDYEWTETDGVINITARRRADGILDIRVGHFRVTNADLFEVHDAIVALPEVKTWLGQKHITEETGFAGSILVGPNGTGSPRASVDLHDVTLRELLNTIIKSGLTSWSIDQWGDGRYLSIHVD